MLTQSVVGLTDSTGALNRAYKYGPAGGISGANGPSTLPTDYFRYRGAYYGSAQMYHFGMRNYDPALRRWTQQDPIDQSGDLKQGMVLYAGDDPVDRADPRGLWAFDIGIDLGPVSAGVSIGDSGVHTYTGTNTGAEIGGSVRYSPTARPESGATETGFEGCLQYACVSGSSSGSSGFGFGEEYGASYYSRHYH